LVVTWFTWLTLKPNQVTGRINYTILLNRWCTNWITHDITLIQIWRYNGFRNIIWAKGTIAIINMVDGMMHNFWHSFELRINNNIEWESLRVGMNEFHTEVMTLRLCYTKTKK
jgi:hypothetical protein